MGTCGFTGLFGAYESMVKTNSPLNVVLILVLICIVLPAILTFIFDFILRKFNLIKDNDLLIISTDKK
jgi:uncharacterized membrane protein